MAARFRFPGEPPLQEDIDERLRAQGVWGLSGYSSDGAVIQILTGIDAFTCEYARKILRDLGGVELNHRTLEPSFEPLPRFVEKPWHEHDEATRQEIVRAWKIEVGLQR